MSLYWFTVSFRLHGTGNERSTSTIEGAKHFMLEWLSDPNKIFRVEENMNTCLDSINLTTYILSKSNSFNEKQKEGSLTMTPKALYMHVTEIYG